MAHELRTRARSSGRAAVERRTAFIGPTAPASERVPPRMWCTVNHLGMMAYSEPGAEQREVTAGPFRMLHSGEYMCNGKRSGSKWNATRSETPATGNNLHGGGAATVT